MLAGSGQSYCAAVPSCLQGMAARLFAFMPAGIPRRLEPCQCGTPTPVLPAGRKAGLPGRLFRVMKRPVWGCRTACPATPNGPSCNALAARQLAVAGAAASRAAAASMPPAANKFGVFFAVYDNFIIFAYPKRQGTLPLRPSKANKTIRLCRQTVTCRCLCTTRPRSTATAKP